MYSYGMTRADPGFLIGGAPILRDVSQKPQYKDVYRRTIEMPQRALLLKVNCCLKVHNAHQKLLSPISG